MSVIKYFKDTRIIILILIVVALALLDLHYGIHLGVEFVGGTEIPIRLSQSVDALTMANLISNLQQRLSTFGLSQVTIEGVGNQEVYVIIPTVSRQYINQTMALIQAQGKFVGIVNGTEAINGSGILRDSIGQLPPTAIQNEVSWGVSFYITDAAAKHFAKAVYGQGGKPLYMFLDRPSSEILILNYSNFGNSTMGINASQAYAAMRAAASFGNLTIPIIAVNKSLNSSSIAFLANSITRHRYKSVVISSDLNSSIAEYAKQLNYTVILKAPQSLLPTFSNATTIDTWPAIGLLSSPLLNPSITNGSVGNSYEISGYAPLNLPKAQQFNYATNQSKKIASILSGGALPVSIIAGTPEIIPPTLGSDVMVTSEYIVLFAIIAISVFISLRYRKLFLIIPIILTTLMELFIVFSIIGLVGTIDVSAVAGIIAVIGTGIDAQIIITDEILARSSDEHSQPKTILSGAFYIVWADAALLIVAMLPLFFSTSLVDVIGFSESTIIGALLGVLITRPAYAAIVSRHFS
ncbi:MAG: hypothetical protein ACP5RP_03655 [Candidatus Micrarchaeia archaeon]